MPDVVSNYQCPACGAPLRFDGPTGRLQCDHCGSSFSAEEIEAQYQAQNQQAAQAFDQQAQPTAEEVQWDVEHMRAYNCPSCGAQLICDLTTAATSCPYCGNPSVIPGQLDGLLKPDCIIPFQVDKEGAIAALKAHYKGKVFLPRTFSDQNHIEQIQGVYVPFWLFDCQARASAQFEGTRSHSHREGQYRVTTTEHFHIRRDGTIDFAKVPVDGSTRMPDDHMDSIEPFDYRGLKPFSMSYLPGFLADKYDVSAQESEPRADLRCENAALEAIRDTVGGYETCTMLGHRVQLSRGRAHYALLPVWMLNTKWQGKDYLFAMNGQTGKLVGDLPTSRAKYWAVFAAIAAPVAAVIAAALFFL